MRRALCTVGFAYLLTQLLAAFLPPVALGPLAAIFIALAVTALCAWPKASAGVWRWRTHALVLLFTVGAAFALRWGYQQLFVLPVQTLCGQTARVEAVVLSVQPAYSDRVYATVKVTQVDGAPAGFQTVIEALPWVQPGEAVAAQVSFEPLDANEYRASSYADGCYVQTVYEENFASLGLSDTWAARFARLQVSLSSGLRSLLPGKYGAVAAAMAVGDRENLTAALKEPFQRAGLSHLLVVSGLHLSIVSALLYGLARLCLSRRRAALAAALASLAFMCLVGFTPSVVRAGVVMLCFYGSMLFHRPGDTLTSLGLAALLLCLQNPYAASDAGLQLSFAATLGVLWAQAVVQRLAARRASARKTLPFKSVLGAAFSVVGATLATLPVLISINAGVSLLGVVCNLLCMVPAGIAVSAGLCAAVCSLVPPLGFLARLSGLVCGLLLRWLFAVAQAAADIPGMFVHVTGTYALCVSAAVCVLVFAAWQLHLPLRRALASCAAFVVLAAALYAVADANVVYFALVGSGVNPPVVVTKGLQTAVLYRGPETNVDAVWSYLEQRNRTAVDWLIDLRVEGDTALLAEQLSAQNVISVQELVNQTVAQPFSGVQIYIKRQVKGNMACVDVGGRRLGVAAGHVDISSYPALDVYFGGSGTPAGLRCEQLILPSGGRFDWAQELDTTLHRGLSTPLVAVRAGGGINVKEIANGFE